MANNTNRDARVMISYAHRDPFSDHALGRLRVHLDPLEREFGIEVWDDTRLRAGSEWKDEIYAAIQAAKVAILMVGADFLSSEFITTHELPLLLEARRTRGLTILQLIASPCDYESAKMLSGLQALNTVEETLSEMTGPKLERFMATVKIEVARRLKPRLPSSEALTTRLQEEHAMERRYNVVAIGKTGVGKSTLVNYIFGRHVRTTGVGRPVTARGFHREPGEIAGVPLMFFDSWGLEVSKHKEWRDDLTHELSLYVERTNQSRSGSIPYCFA